MRSSRFIWPLLLALVLLSSNGAAHGLTIEPDPQFTFARQLYNAGQFRRAGEEFQRFAFFFPDDPRQREAILNAGVSFLRAQDPQTALQEFYVLTGREPLDAIAVEAHFLVADSHLQLNAPTQALVALHNLLGMSADPAVRDRANFRIAMIQVDQTDWPAARRSLERIGPDTPYPVERMLAALDRSGDIPRKSPALAGTLSIVPGAGQLYNGRYQDALTAFILNGLLAWAAVESFDNGQDGLGSLIAFVGFGFYAGNIYGAVSGAHKYNQMQRERFAEELRQQSILPAGGAPPAQANGVCIRIGLRF